MLAHREIATMKISFDKAALGLRKSVKTDGEDDEYFGFSARNHYKTNKQT